MSVWRKIARKNQIIPGGKWNIWLLLAGRGFGKTRAGAEAVLELIYEKKALNIGVLGETVFEAQNIMIEGHSGILMHSQIGYKYQVTKRRILFKNGSVCQYFGADRFDKLRGFQFDLVWIDEFAKFKNCKQVLEQVFMCLRLGITKIIITTTPQNKQILIDLMNSPDTIVTKGTSFENLNLSPEFFKNIEKYNETNFGKQEILGEIVENNLWKREDIKYSNSPTIIKYVIGIDPAVEYGTTGIILAGLGNDLKIYIIEDFSTSRKISCWIDVLKNIINKYEVFDIAIEVNQGGSLLSELILFNKISCNIIKYRARDSKYSRNTFTHFLYQQNQVVHSKKMDNLEEELLNFPKDRADALYWAVFHLQKYI